MRSQVVPKGQFVLDIRVSLLTHVYLMGTHPVGVFAEIEASRSARNRIIQAFPAWSVAKLLHGDVERLDCLDVLDDHKHINDRLRFDLRDCCTANMMYGH